MSLPTTPLAALAAYDQAEAPRLVRGRVLEPLGAPLSLPEELVDLVPAAPAIVLARIDVEEEILPLVRPARGRIDLGVDFVLADESGRALVRAGEPPHLHPDVDLHLGADAAATRALAPLDDGIARVAWLRILRVGDEVAVYGRAGREPDPFGGGYRDGPSLPVFQAALGPLALYDAAALARLTAWYDLPWHRKLAALLRGARLT